VNPQFHICGPDKSSDFQTWDPSYTQMKQKIFHHQTCVIFKMDHSFLKNDDKNLIP
jgi:hypothetical protein